MGARHPELARGRSTSGAATCAPAPAIASCTEWAVVPPALATNPKRSRRHGSASRKSESPQFCDRSRDLVRTPGWVRPRSARVAGCLELCLPALHHDAEADLRVSVAGAQALLLLAQDRLEASPATDSSRPAHRPAGPPRTRRRWRGRRPGLPAGVAAGRCFALTASRSWRFALKLVPLIRALFDLPQRLLPLAVEGLVARADAAELELQRGVGERIVGQDRDDLADLTRQQGGLPRPRA